MCKCKYSGKLARRKSSVLREIRRTISKFAALPARLVACSESVALNMQLAVSLIVFAQFALVRTIALPIIKLNESQNLCFICTIQFAVYSTRQFKLESFCGIDTDTDTGTV